jgi:hypothetical protein
MKNYTIEILVTEAILINGLSPLNACNNASALALSEKLIDSTVFLNHATYAVVEDVAKSSPILKNKDISDDFSSGSYNVEIYWSTSMDVLAVSSTEAINKAKQYVSMGMISSSDLKTILVRIPVGNKSPPIIKIDNLVPYLLVQQDSHKSCRNAKVLSVHTGNCVDDYFDQIPTSYVPTTPTEILTMVRTNCHDLPLFDILNSSDSPLLIKSGSFSRTLQKNKVMAILNKDSAIVETPDDHFLVKTKNFLDLYKKLGLSNYAYGVQLGFKAYFNDFIISDFAFSNNQRIHREDFIVGFKLAEDNDATTFDQ